jgi:threonylcarbamoyladenosine tRNA methylthiotransferase MtaB
VLTHHEDVAASLKRLLDGWLEPGAAPATSASGCLLEPGPGAAGGTTSLPLLSDHAAGHARAFLKVQDGCDAHCTYCIIPRLRPELWSKPLEQAVEEARALVAAGHREIVLTGIFLGAYGQRTALRRRQRAAAGGAASGGGGASLAQLAEALCTRVPGLLRLRFSSLEPMDLSDELIEVLRRLPQVVPHFHLPLQSGSDRLLRRMNRQYRRDEFLRMLDRVRRAFDRPALTTDIICGFPGECDGAFEQTLDIVRRAKFIHVHAFPFSPRPGTAAARWTDDRVPPAIAQARIEQLRQLALDHCQAYRRQFAGETVQVLVERPDATARELGLAHGRCPRYFDVHFHWPQARWGEPIDVRIDRITRTRTFGSVVATAPA